MKSWNVEELTVEAHSPQVLDSSPEGRAIVIQLPAGERLREHQVHERAWLVVVGGKVRVTEPDGEWAEGSQGFLAEFDPNERHEVEAIDDARLLLLLSPWPGEGHPSA